MVAGGGCFAASLCGFEAGAGSSVDKILLSMRQRIEVFWLRTHQVKGKQRKEQGEEKQGKEDGWKQSEWRKSKERKSK